MDITVRRVGFFVLYLGLALMVMSVKVSPSGNVLPLVSLLIIGLLNGFLPERIVSNRWYVSVIIGVTMAMLISPFLVLGIENGI